MKRFPFQEAFKSGSSVCPHRKFLCSNFPKKEISLRSEPSSCLWAELFEEALACEPCKHPCLLPAASTGICSSALAEGTPLHPAPLSPGTARSVLRAQGTVFLLEKKIPWEKQRAEKEQRKRRGSCRKALRTILISHLKIRGKILHPVLDPFRWYVGDCTLSLTRTWFYLMSSKTKEKGGEDIQREGGEPHLQKWISQTSCESLSGREPRTSRPEWITTHGILWSTLAKGIQIRSTTSLPDSF